jgi:ERO1-like protein alpha
MHASISQHLVSQWLLDEASGTWGPNLEEFERRFTGPEAADRVANLYFAYLFTLRAVIKASPLLLGYAYDTGLPEEDAAAHALVQQLVCMAAALCAAAAAAAAVTSPT